ncbi:SMC family ATPase, partial [bacterium]|nr:SMC family ATPase [bacterium]
MIVRSLFARNFMKYEELSIAEFPRTGVIGIIGDNESGKTTILEAITLALFGRTLKVEEQSYARLVYWKDSEMEVRLTFEIDEEVYRIWRRYDRGGGKEALLYRIVDEREELITQGLGPVNDRIEALFPINFEVCRQSFYLGQKELSHLYEKRVPNSIEMVEKMTGLDQLKRAHGQVQEKLPDLQDQLIELEKQLSIYSVKVEGLEERLVERNSIEVDLDRQKLRLEEIQTECKTQEENVEIQEQVRRTLQKLVDQFRELRATFLGNEFKRRLILNSQHFLSLYRGLKETCTQVEEEVQSLRKDVEAREKRHSLSNEVFKDLKGILYLVQDRIHQIDRNTTSQIGSENIRSYFSPETLKDREVLCEHQIKEAQESAQTLSRSYKLSLLLLCLVLVPPLLLEGANVYPWFDKITLQPMAFQVGIVLFIIPTLALLFYFLVTRSRYLRVAKEMLGKLRMLLSVLQRDLQEEAEERAKLAQFELEGVGSLEDLAEVRSMMRYEPLRKLINELIDTYEDRKALFTVGFKDALGFEQEIKKDVEILKEKRIILDQLKHLIGQYCELIEEIQAWSFTEDGDHAEIAQDFSAEFLSSSSKILRLKELLRGDYSHEKRQLDDALDAYVKLVESLCQVASEHPGLLPDIFDEKRLRWDWDSQRLVDLDLVA